MTNKLSAVRFRLSGEGRGVAQTIREEGSPHIIQTDAHPAFGGADSAPSPLAYALAALTSCTQVVARDLGLSLGRFKIDVDASLDPTVLATGAEGVSNFSELTLAVTIETDAAPETLQHLAREVERRCPVSQLFRRSGVHVTTSWTAAATSALEAA